jgi:hypothetical protein
MLREYELFLVNVNNYVPGQILDIFDRSLKLYRFYNLTEPERGMYPDIQRLHEVAMAALRTFVRRCESSHGLLKIDLDDFAKPDLSSTVDSLAERLRVKNLVDEAWRDLDTVQSELLKLKTRLRYQTPSEIKGAPVSKSA